MLGARDVVVLGSAPLSPHELVIIQNADKLICVNGSISSTARIPDVWVLNSRHYDDIVYTNPKRWPEERKQLHEAMMAQAANKRARHILFLLKSYTPNQTIARLRQQNTRWRGQTVFSADQKTALVQRAGVHKFPTAFNISAGLFGACLALRCKAASVTLCGFSFTDGHAYLPDATQHRFHIAQDQEAIADLMQRHSATFRIASLTGSPELQRTGD